MKPTSAASSARIDLSCRLSWLVDTLRHHGRLTYEQIAALWRDCPINRGGDDMALRTFHYHRQAIREWLGLSIVCDPRDGYTYRLERPERLGHDALLSRMIDVSALHAVADGNAVGRWIEAEPPSGGHEHVTAIAQAMARGRAVELQWQGGQGESAWSERLRFEPYCLKESGGDWWVIGRDVKADAVKACCLGDLHDMRVLDNLRYERPEGWSAREWLEGCSGMLREEDVARVVIRVRYHARRQVAAHPLHSTQREVGRDARSVTYEYRVRPNYDFVQKLMSLTDQIEVVEPQSLRDELNRVAFKLIEYYNKGR